jgi:Cof subfamily protein (haloacid dehalogenase superfamily)
LSMQGIKLLVLDVDGTVLTSDHRILPAVIDAVARARASGITVALATARSPRGLRPIAAALGIERCICFNGAWSGALGAGPARAASGDETLLPLQHARTAARFAVAAGLSVGWYVGESWHVAALTAAIEREAGVTGEIPLVCPDLAGLDEAPHKIMCIAGQDMDIPALQRVAQAFRGMCTVSFSHTNFLEITSLGVDKAKAVAELATRLGASLAQVAAIGDSDNDRTMIETVGLGIAMGNASAELRSRAVWVTSTNQEAGVARAIERLIDGGACDAREPMPRR